MIHLKLKFFAILALIFVTGNSALAQIAINEVMAANRSTVADEDGDYPDWIELYNYSSASVNLHGYGLSDDYDRPYRWVFHDFKLDAGTFVLVWASNKDRRDPARQLHANFAISSSGEEVLLTDPSGRRVDEMPPVEMQLDISYGRYPDGTGEFVFFADPTPGKSNHGGGAAGVLDTPVFSVEPGFYRQTVELRIIHPDPDVRIYFTTDGKVPDENSSLYTATLRLDDIRSQPNAHSLIPTTSTEQWQPPVGLVDKAHIIRAVAVKPGWVDSEVVAGTWFVGNEVVPLPVVSIIAPLEHFFDYHTGIYVPGWFHNAGQGGNYTQRGIEWERMVAFEMFVAGRQEIAQQGGVRIHGGVTRAFPQKSLRLYARGAYGQSHFEYPVFEDAEFGRYKRLLLRNSGNDFYLQNYGVMFRDAFMQTLVADLNFQTQDYRPAVLYLNGEYWGIHNFRERYDKHFIERVYGVREEHLDLLTGNAEVKEGSAEYYLDMINFVENNCLSDNDNFAKVTGWMDVENYTDYIIANLFFGNTDWPGHNTDFWRYSGPVDPDVPEKDGRWRWLMYDTDFGFGMHNGPGSWEFDMMEYILKHEVESWEWAPVLFRALFENPAYRLRFMQRFDYLLDTVFVPSKMIALIYEMAITIAAEIPRHIRRWSGGQVSFDQWVDNVQLMRDFAALRPEWQRRHLRRTFQLYCAFSPGDPWVMSDGSWRIWRAVDGFKGVTLDFNIAGSPVMADFDGDGFADPTVMTPDGTWHAWLSSQSYAYYGAFPLGVAGMPVAADFDGDGFADPAVMTPDGTWHVWLSSMGYNYGGAYRLGVEGMPKAADFDGDGLADPAVFDAAGAWHVWLSSHGYHYFGDIKLP